MVNIWDLREYKLLKDFWEVTCLKNLVVSTGLGRASEIQTGKTQCFNIRPNTKTYTGKKK